MNAERSLFQSLLWRGLYYVSAFIINILITRHFQASVSGTVYYISSIYALVLLFASFSLESGIIYFTARKEIPAGKLFSFSMGWSLLCGTAVFLGVYFFFPKAYNELSSLLLIFSSVAFIFGNLLSTYCSSFFYAHNHFAVPNIINIICTVILMLLLPYNGKSLLPSVTDNNYFYIYFGSFMLQGVLVAIAAKLTYISGNKLHALSVADFSKLLRYCLLAFLGNVIYFFLYRVDYWFVEKYCTPAELGNYIQVSKLGHLFFILPTIFASAVFPLTASGKKEDVIHVLTLLLRVIFTGYLFCCGLLALVGNWLFPFVFGESFSDMYLPFVLLIPGILSLSGLFVITAYFAGQDKVRKNITGTVYALAVILAGDILFIPHYGIPAAAMVSSAGYIVFQVYIVTEFRKESAVPLGRLFLLQASDIQEIKRMAITLLKGRGR